MPTQIFGAKIFQISFDLFQYLPCFWYLRSFRAICVKTIAEGEFSAVESFGTGAGKKNLTTQLKGKLGKKPDEAITAIVLPSTLQTIGDYAFYSHTNVTGTFTVPEQVNSIGENSFYSLGKNSSSLAITFTEPSQLTTIGKGAFYLARTSVLKLPQSLKTIEDFAFLDLEGVSATNTFTIPANVESVGSLAFADLIRPVITGTLTIESPYLIRTPADTAQELTGNLGSGLFMLTGNGTLKSNFTTIKLPKVVHKSYKTAELAAIFGTGVTYQDLNGNDH